MKKTTIILICTLLLLLQQQVLAAQKDVLILEFLLEEIELCSTNYDCRDISKKQLLQSLTCPVTVLNYDRNEGMLMFKYNASDTWVHQSEVKLNIKSVASAICSKKDSSITNSLSQPDRTVYATFGLGEGCN